MIVDKKEKIQEAKRAYARAYREKNREKLRAYHRAWNAANRDKVLASQQRFYERKAKELEEAEQNG